MPCAVGRYFQLLPAVSLPRQRPGDQRALDPLATRIRSLPCLTARALLHRRSASGTLPCRSEEHTSELQSPVHLVCRLLLEKTTVSRRYCNRLLMLRKHLGVRVSGSTPERLSCSLYPRIRLRQLLPKSGCRSCL